MEQVHKDSTPPLLADLLPSLEIPSTNQRQPGVERPALPRVTWTPSSSAVTSRGQCPGRLCASLSSPTEPGAGRRIHGSGGNAETELSGNTTCDLLITHLKEVSTFTEVQE